MSEEPNKFLKIDLVGNFKYYLSMSWYKVILTVESSLKTLRYIYEHVFYCSVFGKRTIYSLKGNHFVGIIKGKYKNYILLQAKYNWNLYISMTPIVELIELVLVLRNKGLSQYCKGWHWTYVMFCSAKKYTKHSIVLLLWLVYFSSEQTLH